MFQLILY